MKRSLKLAAGLVCALLLIVPAWAGDADHEKSLQNNWPGFRGYCGLGVCTDRTPPTDWDGETGKNVAWKVKLPLPGTNSPVVWEDRLFVTGATEEQHLIYCLATKTGAIRWEHKAKDIPNSPDKAPEVMESAGFASPSMACDGERVFAVFANGDLVCCDLDGNRVWAKSLGLPDIDYGYVSSPVAFGGRLYVQLDELKKGHVFAFDAKTGDEVWKVERDVKNSWASPIIANTSKGHQLIVNGHPTVAAYDPATGKELWAEECMRGELTPSPAFASDTVVFAQEYATCVAFNAVTSKMTWEQLDIDLPDVSSPVAFGNYVIMPTSIGVAYCLSLKEGKVMWEQEYDEGFYASPVVVDDKVFLLDREGTMLIFKASAEYQLIGSPKLPEETVATPAFVNDKIYIRGAEHLYCIGQ